MPRVSLVFHQSSFRIKHDNSKLFDKLLSNESSKSNPSFRLLYYGDVPDADPFVWETCPVTPKHTSFPHYLSLPSHASYYSKKKYSGSKLALHALLRRMNPNKKNSHSSSSSLSSLSKSLSSNSWFSD